jgi:hypothetical protein
MAFRTPNIFFPVEEQGPVIFAKTTYYALEGNENFKYEAASTII